MQHGFNIEQLCKQVLLYCKVLTLSSEESAISTKRLKENAWNWKVNTENLSSRHMKLERMCGL